MKKKGIFAEANGYSAWDVIGERSDDFDVSDTPVEPVRKRVGASPPPGPHLNQTPGKKTNPVRNLPGLSKEATPFGGPTKPPNPMTTPPRRRAGSTTTQFQIKPGTDLQHPSMAGPSVSSPDITTKTSTGEQSWDVYVQGAGVYKVPASSEQEAKSRAQEYLKSDPEHSGKTFSPNDFQAASFSNEFIPGGENENEASSAGSAGPGPQHRISAEGLAIFHQLVNLRIQEIVRKKPGGGGYNLFPPNKGKKKKAEPVGEFPTRTAAKNAELARFPPKDPEQLKRARARLDKLKKDPKKRIEQEKEDLTGQKKQKRSGRTTGARKARKESIVNRMVNDLTERLFREEEMPGSPWDERVSTMHPDDIAADKRLHRFHSGIEKASIGALGSGHKSLAKALKGMAGVNPGDITRDPDRGKMFMPISLDLDGQEIGPIHLYIDGGNVCIEISQDAREMMGGLEPDVAKGLRGGLMSFQEDLLPKIVDAKKAWTDRDSYLDNLHKKLEKQVGGMSSVEKYLASKLMNRGRRR